MKCKINSSDKSRLTRTSSSARTIKSTISSTTSSSHPTNFKIKFKHGLSPSRNSSIHGCRTQTRSSTSSIVSTSKGKPDIKNADDSRVVIRDKTKEMKKPKEDAHQCKCICSNCGLSINNSGSSERDVSMIREPINLGTNNVRQILQCVHNGTPEIKDIVLNECNIIYECRICRSLFRSLANLLSHKRFYCKDHQCENMLLFDDKYSDNYTIDVGSKAMEDIEPKSHNNRQTLSENNTPVATNVPTNKQKGSNLRFPDSDNSRLLSKSSQDNVASSSNIQPDKLAAKRKHLELCVKKLLNEKQSSKVESFVHLTEISTTKNAVNQVYETKPKESISIDNFIHNSHSSNQDGEFPTQEMHQSSSFPASGSQYHEESIKEMKGTIYNIDENANHPVACQDSNAQETGDYAQSIASLVSDDGECSGDSEMKSESLSELENESMDIKESSQQSMPSSASSSSSTNYLGREHSSNRNKPKTFNDEYETPKSPSIATIPCSMCNSMFSSKKTLNVHIQTIHNVQRLVYPCPFCCLTFKQLFNATRHMIQVHRKGKTQVKYLREAVKRRAYPEIKSEMIDESETIHADYSVDAYGPENVSDVSRDILDMDQEKGECYSLSDNIQQTTASELALVPIKVGKSSKRKGCDKSKEYKSTIELSSGETNTFTKTFGTENTDLESNSEQPSNTLTIGLVKDEDSKSTLNNQEKIRRVNPIIFSCINNCGKYFIKVDSKTQHEKGCSKPDESDKEIIPKDSIKSSEKDSNFDLVIPGSIHKELEKVGNFINLQCNSCPALQFDSKANLIEHLVTHKGYEIFKCSKCTYQTLDRTELDNHLNSKHEERENCSVKPSTPNDQNLKKNSFQTFKEDSQDNKRSQESKSSEKSISSGLVLHLRPKLSRNRKKKKIYEIVGD